METLTQRLDRVNEAHWDGLKLNLRQTLIHSITAITNLSYEEISSVFERRCASLAGFSPDDLILIGHELEVREYFANKYIPEALEKEGVDVKRLLPALKRNAITVYELLSQGFDVKFFHAEAENQKHAVVVSKGKYTNTTYFMITQNMDGILYSAYTAILKEQKKDLL